MSPQAHGDFDFLAPGKIVFGWSRRREVGALARTLGRRAFIISGAKALTEEGLIDEVSAALHEEKIESVVVATIGHEPLVADIDRLSSLIHIAEVAAGDFMLAVGGGAAIDLAKALGAMAVVPESATVQDYLEGVGRGLSLTERPLPLLAMPTTAGTGAEATRNAVISSLDPPFKRSLRHEWLIPRLALIDPELTVSVPPPITASAGMDAVTQLIESFISKKARPVPRALAREGLRAAVPALAEAYRDGRSRPAREGMAYAALLSGMALANSGLGMAHGVAAALGVHCRVPHGLACAVMLPAALKANREVCLPQYAELACLLFGRTPSDPPEVAADAFIEGIEALCREVSIPERLSAIGVRPEQIPRLVRDSRGSSMSGNPRDLSDAELTAILEAML